MGISPEYAGDETKQEKRKGEHMCDVATANFLVEQIGGKRRVNEMLYAAFRELSKRFPHREDPHNKWTERRLRGWWNNESQVVKHFQMAELFDTAEALRAARNEHAEYITKTARLRKMAELRKAGGNRSLAER
ncbi:MAG: hypothetical protein QMD99_20195, partial [Rhizobiaceae bacterium]|nr:hypothetical protein [Rhizobiaceae bacterium]